jgi:hypothetical protein
MKNTHILFYVVALLSACALMPVKGQEDPFPGLQVKMSSSPAASFQRSDGAEDLGVEWSSIRRHDLDPYEASLASSGGLAFPLETVALKATPLHVLVESKCPEVAKEARETSITRSVASMPTAFRGTDDVLMLKMLITTFDSSAKKTHGGDSWGLYVFGTADDGDQISAAGAVIDHWDGTYSAYVSLPTTGSYSLLIVQEYSGCEGMWRIAVCRCLYACLSAHFPFAPLRHRTMPRVPTPRSQQGACNA